MVAERDIPLIEDVIYNELARDPDKRRAVKSFDTSGHVMMCGSFTKTVAPGIRIGWVDAGRWRDAVVRLKAATSGAQTPIMDVALAELLSQPGQESAYRQLRQAVAARMDQARGLIAESFPKGTRVTDPPGGYILWLELPRNVDSQAVFEACLAERICIAPGSLFSASTRFKHCIRLGLGGRWDEAQRAALRKVGDVVRALADQA